jgi:predicted small secreted protein
MNRIILALIAVLTLAACNTMRGAGQDISTAGDALSSEAAETQSEM